MNDKRLTQTLLDWYDRVQRLLPWRGETDPYRIWVSEIMLQQTRVETVIPYYHRFLQRFPDLQALAGASEEDVLSAWQGLGYYSRVRNLQRGAREVVARHGGKIPDSPPELRALPGIGAYTAGAILSIAYHQAEPAVDGNVLRVFSRLLKIEEPVETPRTKHRIEAAVRAMMSTVPRYGEITQALMELGAMVCIPRSPRCEDCPWAEGCIARQQQLQALLPKKKSLPPPRIVEVLTGILIADDRVLAVKRPANGLLAGMWEFPSVEKADAGVTLPEEQLLFTRFSSLGQEVTVNAKERELTHIFSHREWRMRIFSCRAIRVAEPLPENALWVDKEQLSKLIWAGPHRKLAAEVEKALMHDCKRKVRSDFVSK